MWLDSQWIVKNTVHDFLIGTGIRWIAVKDLTNAVNTSSAVVPRPEILLDVLDSVHAQTVNYNPQLDGKVTVTGL